MALPNLRAAFAAWGVSGTSRLSRGEDHQESSMRDSVAFIDGKTMRGSTNKALNEKACHILSLRLTHTRVDDKSDEIPVSPELLEAPDLERTLLSMDAMHTQKTLRLIRGKGHYRLFSLFELGIELPCNQIVVFLSQNEYNRKVGV